jgi:gas vesicle protein
MKSVSSFIAGLLAGAAIGGTIALLYAPHSGKETREKLKIKLTDLEKEFETIKGKASQKSDKVRKDIADKLNDLQRDLENLSKAV